MRLLLQQLYYMYFNICTARTCTFGILITVKENGILNTQAGFIVGVAVYKKEFGGEQRRQSGIKKHFLAEKSLMIMAEHLKSISNTVVFSTQNWIVIIWLFNVQNVQNSNSYVMNHNSLEG